MVNGPAVSYALDLTTVSHSISNVFSSPLDCFVNSWLVLVMIQLRFNILAGVLYRKCYTLLPEASKYLLFGCEDRSEVQCCPLSPMKSPPAWLRQLCVFCPWVPSGVMCCSFIWASSFLWLVLNQETGGGAAQQLDSGGQPKGRNSTNQGLTGKKSKELLSLPSWRSFCVPDCICSVSSLFLVASAFGTQHKPSFCSPGGDSFSRVPVSGWPHCPMGL